MDLITQHCGVLLFTHYSKLNRLENQQIYPQVTEFDLGEQLCECLLQYENIWEKAEIGIETEIAENVIVKADEELLSHVWNNLFSNAFKFTPSGGTVTVSLTATEHHAIVKVTDTGCGMTPEVGLHIFEKFYQGEISVESAVGKGLVFTGSVQSYGRRFLLHFRNKANSLS